MEITPRRLRDVVFRERLRGYDEDDVDEFLERVATGVEILQERLRHAVERAELAERRGAEKLEGDDAMRRTLTLAQRTADLAVEEAKQQAARIVEDASEQGRQVVQRAQELARREAMEAQEALRSDITQLEAAREQLRDDVAAFGRYLDAERHRLRLALGDAVRWIEEGIPSLVPPPVVHQPTVPSLPPEPPSADPVEVPKAAVEVPKAAVELPPPAPDIEAVAAPVRDVQPAPTPVRDVEPPSAPEVEPPPAPEPPQSYAEPPLYEQFPAATVGAAAPQLEAVAARDDEVAVVHEEAPRAQHEATTADEVAPEDAAAGDGAEDQDDAASASSDEDSLRPRRGFWRRWSSSRAEHGDEHLDAQAEAEHQAADSGAEAAPSEPNRSDGPSADVGAAPDEPPQWPFDHAGRL